MPHEQTPKEQKPQKTREERIQEEIDKARIKAEAELRMSDELAQQELDKQRRRQLVQRRLLDAAQERNKVGISGARTPQPFETLLATAGVQAKALKQNSDKQQDHELQLTEDQKAMRQETMDIANTAAELLAYRKVNTSLVVKVEYDVQPPRKGLLRKEPAPIRQTSTLEHGWEIPLTSKYHEPGARVVLCEDGRILSLRAHEKDGELITRPESYSYLNKDFGSDIATRPLPTDNPEGAHAMALRREMEVREGLAALLVDNGVSE